jgi:hypothetical protein
MASISVRAWEIVAPDLRRANTCRIGSLVLGKPGERHPKFGPQLIRAFVGGGQMEAGWQHTDYGVGRTVER